MVDDDFYALSPEQKKWVMARLYDYRKNVQLAYTSDPEELDKAQDELKAFLIQRAKAQQETNGPERWHDALTKYTELEVRIARLEHTVYVLEHELANFMGRFANKA